MRVAVRTDVDEENIIQQYPGCNVRQVYYLKIGQNDPPLQKSVHDFSGTC